jgi:hypothetical protein
MFERLLKFGLCYIGYGVELTLFIALACHGRWKRLTNLFVYLALLFTVDGAGRMYALYRFGQRSATYSYFYWLSDDLLALAAFGLVCSFFRRACREKKELWHSIRFFLLWVFVLAVLSTTFSLHRNLDHLHFNRFVTEFEQNLYFSCLVLNTLLYISMQYIGNKDDELNLLVCGMGIQFAGPAASLAFSTLTPGGHPLSLFSYVDQLCFLGMLLVWAYAVVRVPKVASIRVGSEQVQPLAERAIRRAV